MSVLHEFFPTLKGDKMSQEKLNHVVTGVLYDFMGYLTTREEQIVLSSHDDASPAVTTIEDFLLKRNVDYADPLHQWEDRCTKIDDVTWPRD